MPYQFPFEKLDLRAQNEMGTTDSALYFTHKNITPLPTGRNAKPSKGDALVIPTGANNVEWGYTLNTQRFPTYGGEVVQILSMAADTMKVSGVVRNYEEQRIIYNYFLKYLKLAGGMGAGSGTNERIQTPITFSYPARGWSFDIIIVNLDNMIQDLQTVTPTWGFTAEIVSENDRYELGGGILSGMSNVLTSDTIIRNVFKGDGIIGFDPSNPFSGPSSSSPEQFGSVLDERLQQQIGSWLTDNYSQYLFQDAITNNSDTSFKSNSEYYTSMFGTDVAFTVDGTGGGGNENASGPLSNLSGQLTGPQVAALASQGFKDQGYDSVAMDKEILTKAVAVAYAESGWDTQAVNHNRGGASNNGHAVGVDGENPISTSNPHPTYDDFINKSLNDPQTLDDNWDLGLWQINVYYKSSWSDADGRKVNDNRQALLDDPVYNARAMASDSNGGTKWNAWTTFNNGKYAPYISKARTAVQTFLDNPEKYANTGTVISKPTGTTLNKAVQIAKTLINFESQIHYSQDSRRTSFYANYQDWDSALAALNAGEELYTDCSAFVWMVFRWAGGQNTTATTSTTMCDAFPVVCPSSNPTDAQLASVLPGDIQSGNDHAQIIVGTKGKGKDILFNCITMGEESGPKYRERDFADFQKRYKAVYRWPGIK